jgi:hypothetical protein
MGAGPLESSVICQKKKKKKNGKYEEGNLLHFMCFQSQVLQFCFYVRRVLTALYALRHQ